jgi:hypothetical protein
MTSPLEFWDWLRIGIDAGWVSEPVCATHEGVPTTVEGMKEWDEGHDPCEHIVRLIPDDEHLSQ